MIAYILNIIDLGFTLHALGRGVAECNPLMRSVPVMVAYKVLIIGALCFWLSHRQERLAQHGLKAITAVYAAVDLWHIVNIAPSFGVVFFR